MKAKIYAVALTACLSLGGKAFACGIDAQAKKPAPTAKKKDDRWEKVKKRLRQAKL